MSRLISPGKPARYSFLAVLLAFSAAVPVRAQDAAGDFPPAGDTGALVSWLGQRTNIAPGAVVVATPTLVVAIVGKTLPPTPQGPMRVTLREEVIAPAFVDAVGGRSSLMSMDIQCEERRIRMDERRIYPGPNLGGQAQIAAPSASWVRIPESSIMDQIAAAACEDGYDWPLKSFAVAANAPAPVTAPVAVPAKTTPPEPAPVVLAAAEPEPAAPVEQAPSPAGTFAIPLGSYRVETPPAAAPVAPELMVLAQADPAPPAAETFAIPLGSYHVEAPPPEAAPAPEVVVAEAEPVAPEAEQPTEEPAAPEPVVVAEAESVAPPAEIFAIPLGSYHVEPLPAEAPAPVTVAEADPAPAEPPAPEVVPTPEIVVAEAEQPTVEAPPETPAAPDPAAAIADQEPVVVSEPQRVVLTDAEPVVFPAPQRVVLADAQAAPAAPEAFAIPFGSYRVETPPQAPDAPPEPAALAKVKPALQAAVTPSVPSRPYRAETPAPQTEQPDAQAFAIPLGEYRAGAGETSDQPSPVYAIQIGAYRSLERAQQAWDALSAGYPSLVKGLRFEVRPVKVKGRDLLRGLVRDFKAPSEGAAFCSALAGSGYGCILRALAD